MTVLKLPEQGTLPAFGLVACGSHGVDALALRTSEDGFFLMERIAGAEQVGTQTAPSTTLTHAALGGVHLFSRQNVCPPTTANHGICFHICLLTIAHLFVPPPGHAGFAECLPRGQPHQFRSHRDFTGSLPRRQNRIGSTHGTNAPPRPSPIGCFSQ